MTYIGARAFENTPLTHVILNENTAFIGENAFAGTKLNEFVIPANAQMDASSLAGIPLENIRISDNATDEQKAIWNENLGFAWYNPLLRVSEVSEFISMPNMPSDEADFEIDPSNGMLTAYTGNDVDVVIPRTIGGIPVKTISMGAFDIARDYTDSDMIGDEKTHWLPLRSVVIPESVTAIEDGAFSYCQQLENLICYAPLESTGRSAFQLCRNLKNVIFVNRVKILDNYVFSRCESLENVYYPGTLDAIGDNAFEFSGIESFAADTKVIGDSAFRDCEKLKDIHIRGHLEKMALNAFYGCTALKRICLETKQAAVFDDANGYSGDCADGIEMILPKDTSDSEMEEIYNKWSRSSLGPIADKNQMSRADCLQPNQLPLPDLDALLLNMGETKAIEPKPTLQTAAAMQTDLPPSTDTEFIAITWVCTQAEASGFPLDIAMLGRYDVVFNADGTASMIISGIDLPGAQWIDNGTNITVDYYGVPYIFERAEGALLLNYFDSMMLTYEKE